MAIICTQDDELFNSYKDVANFIYITPHNYKELKQAIEESIQNTEEEELE